ncbi:PepSY-associated TM helix domain-containing protein [Methylomicrobium sp. Wu6]|uniref:PepSY-associated TM helix domain-containing protein n=1 Tax=Methylomicrobium sp. Wu6 TaxID=3107928 RepID=UPI002DD65F53|nr:PepSY-associated TM helix domain-containing protein [Methylomicrobium sp. Wu6]MEC4748533.1 PepSY-associated TM helix domain-containing protein [Methylomicrobium sp. Wu6]
MSITVRQLATLDNARLARRKRHRKLWLKVHLWLGLLFGAYLAVIGLTGSILVFHDEIDEWLTPELMTVEPPSETSAYRSLAAIIAASSAAMPSDAQQAFAAYPRNAKAAFRLRYAVPIPGGATEFWETTVDPYRAKFIGKRLRWSSEETFPETFVDFVFFLHYSLFLGDSGELIVSLIGVLSILSMLTGLIVWWPLTGKWRQALTIKVKASAERLTFDLHKTAGVYSAMVLLPVLFSGIYITEPNYVVPVVELFSPATYRYWFQSTPIESVPSLGMADAVAIADRLYPSGRTHFIYGATQPTSTFTVCKNDVEQTGSLIHRRCVVIDRYSGTVLDVDDPTAGTAGEVLTHWQWPLHSGQAFGMAGRVMVCLSGLACVLLFGTGIVRWRHKKIANLSRRIYR